MNFETLVFDCTDGIARVTLRDREGRNTINGLLVQELADAVARIEAWPELRVVVIAAEGPVFSFGGDIDEFIAERADLQTYVRRMALQFHAAVGGLHRLAAPVVVAVNGFAAGGGMSLALMGDHTIAARSARFNLAYTGSGLTPDGGATWFLPRLVGYQRAFDIAAMNPTLSADQAQALGLIARVVEDDELVAAVEEAVQRLAAMPSDAVQRTKRLLRQSLDAGLDEQLEREARNVSQVAASAATLATLDAFLARRRGH